MKTKHIHTSLLCSSLIGILLLVAACKKKSNEETTVHWDFKNPVTGQGYAGVKVSIHRVKDLKNFNIFSLDSKTKSEIIWEGVTDSNGEVTCSFKAYNNKKYNYFDYTSASFLDLNLYHYQRPSYDELNKNQVNNLVWRSVGKGKYVSIAKNISCFDSNDQMKLRQRNLCEMYNSWSPWGPTRMGCYYNISAPQYEDKPYSIFVNEIESTKNGITTTKLDTFYFDGIGVDTMKIYY